MANKIPEEGRGVLFSNTKKTHPKAPDFKGTVMINGNIIHLSGWKRTSPYGELISLQHNTYQQQKETQYPKEVNSFNDGDVPF